MANRLMSILRFVLRRQKIEQELDTELRYHFERLTEQNIARGMSVEEARRQAMLAIGGVEPTKEKCRDARRGRAVETILQDLRYAARVLRKNPGFSAAAIITLAFGIGANTAIFSVVYGVLLRPLPYAQDGQLVVLHQNAVKAKVYDMAFSVKDIQDYREQSHTLAGIVEHHSMNFLLIDGDRAERVDAAIVSANFFDVLGIRPLFGRTFVASDEAPGTPAVLILTHKYWQTRHGGDPNIVGKIFHLNNRPHTAIGVLPPIPQYPQEADVYMPTSQCPTRSSEAFKANRHRRMMTVFARLKPGITTDHAQADLSVVASQIEKANPDVYPKQDGYGVVATPLREDLAKRARTMFLVLLGVTGFVLLIACANVANLLLAHLLKIERELAVRAALGASRMRLMRQVVTESVLLSLLGGAAGLLFAPWALTLLVSFAQRFTERASEVRIDAPVLLFTLIVSVLTGMVFGLVPALFSGQWMGDVSRQAGTWGTASRRRHVLRTTLIVTQVAMTVVLLAGAGLMIRSFARLQKVNPGFAPERLLTMRISPPTPPYTAETLRLLADRIINKVRTLNGVESAALAGNSPFSPAGIVYGPGASSYEIEGKPSSKDELKPKVDVTIVGANYFETIRQPVPTGRSFTTRDEREAPEVPAVVVINETMARHRFLNENPIGRRIRFDQGTNWTSWLEVVGVASDVKEYGLARPVADEIYGIYRSGFVGRLIVRTANDPNNMTAAVRDAIREIDSLIAVDRIDTVEHAEYESMASPRVMTFLLAIFAALAIVISCSGIGAVMALGVSQRTREIGIRMALGARVSSIISMVLRQGLELAFAGIIVGMGAAAALTRLLAAFLYGTSPTDFGTFVAAPLLFLMVTAVACFIPARLASSIDPLIALREE